MTASTLLTDTNAHASKNWIFDTNAGATQTLVTTYKEQNSTTGTVLRQVNYTWTQDTGGNNYISRTQEISDPGQTYA